MIIIHAAPSIPVDRVYFPGLLMLSLTMRFALVGGILMDMMQARALMGLHNFQWSRAMRKVCPREILPLPPISRTNVYVADSHSGTKSS